MRVQKFHIEISNVCNFACSFCPEVIRPKAFMTLPQFSEIVSKTAPYCEEYAFHLMGEPLLHKGLKQFLDICEQHKKPVNITTNAYLLGQAPSFEFNQSLADTLLHPIIRQINFSLQSFIDNKPETGLKGLNIYLRNIVSLIEKAQLRRPDLYLNLRLWNMPKHETKVLMSQFLREADLHQASLVANGIEKHENSQELLFAWMLNFLEKELNIRFPDEVDLSFRKSRKLKDRLYVHFDSRFDWPHFNLPNLGKTGTCKGLDLHAGILVDGTVVPCCLDKEGQISLGNILSQSWLEIATQGRAQKILNGFKKGILHETLCQHCNYIQRFKKQALGKARKND